MKVIRNIGSLAFVLGLFTVIFVGIPWHLIYVEEAALPLWLTIAVFCVLGGIFVVLVSVAIEQRMHKKPVKKPESTKPLSDVLILNSDEIPNKKITKILGLVQGHTVFAIWLGKDLSALIRLVLGGELTEYTDMMAKARSEAINRMISSAADMGADAIINVRYMTTSVVGTAAELLAYGTAVKLS